MITVYKDISPAFISIKDFDMQKNWTFSQANIGSGSDDILVFEGKYVHSSSDENTQKIVPIYDESGYIINYNYTLANGDKYMPVSESLNPNGSVKRMIFHAVKNLYYSSSNSIFYEENVYDLNSLSSGSLFLFVIPQKYLAETIDPGTLIIEENSDNDNLPYGFSHPNGMYIVDYNDSRKGKLYDLNNSIWTGSIGNISYDTGQIIITDYEYAKYFINVYIDYAYSWDFNMTFNSYYLAHQYEYVCVANFDEFNGSLNPTLYDTDGIIKDQLINDPNFTTFVTTIGLYDDFGQLIATGKLAKPLRKQKSLDSVYIVKFDA